MDQPFYWKIFEHDDAAVLEERLKALGFGREDDEYDVIMILDLEAIPERLLLPVTKDVRQLRHADQIRDVVSVLDEAYGGDFYWLQQRMGSVIEIPDYLDLYAGYEDGDPVACGWAYAYPNIEFTALFGGTTVEAHRSKGWFSRISAARVQYAKTLGRRYATLGVEPECQGMLEKYGFERISSAYYLNWMRSRSISP
jgi:GNAT superfamily N-acetyltransferase